MAQWSPGPPTLRSGEQPPPLLQLEMNSTVVEQTEKRKAPKTQHKESKRRTRNHGGGEGSAPLCSISLLHRPPPDSGTAHCFLTQCGAACGHHRSPGPPLLTVLLILSPRGLSAPAHLCRLMLTALQGRVDGTIPGWLAQLQARGGATDTFPGPGLSTRLHL